ncbi:hypothetical protein [Lysinibacillus mangiferihumi]
MTLIIRQMNEDDISSVQEIAQTSWTATYEKESYQSIFKKISLSRL